MPAEQWANLTIQLSGGPISARHFGHRRGVSSLVKRELPVSAEIPIGSFAVPRDILGVHPAKVSFPPDGLLECSRASTIAASALRDLGSNF